MLVELAHFHPKLKGLGVYTFEDLLQLPFGKPGHNFILASMFLTAYGAMVAYLLIIKDTLPSVLGLEDEPGEGSFLEREVVMVVTSFCIVVPLSMQRDMSSLACTSALSVTADAFLVLFISAYSPIGESIAESSSNGRLGPIIKENWINSGFFIGFGVLTIAMTCQHSAFIVSGSLYNLTSQRWGIVTSRSLSFACLLCAILGMTGYLGFLDETKGDILNNFESDTLEANAARFLLAITMFFTYPMEAFVARHVLVKLFYDGDLDGTVDPNTGQPTESAGCWNRRIRWTIYLYLLTLLPALLVDDLGPVLSITGSVGGCCLAYIGPGLAYLGVNGEYFLAHIASIVDGKNRKPDEGVMGSLPVAGDATASIQTNVPSVPRGPKPWWWYITLMPLWVKIAKNGADGMQERLHALGHAGVQRDHGVMTPSTSLSEGDSTIVETIGPNPTDYYFSIFFIIFGVIAGLAGVLSNLYVQYNAIFYTPT